MKTYNKLIRDKIPEIIKANGDEAKIRKLSDAEFKPELLKKLLEEVQEVATAADKQELIKEISDVLEVFDALIQHEQLDWIEIERVRTERKNKRGGFEQQLFLESTNEK
jgi:predicted house-cleaning noncanonical NTP pyrophosphatase (MazG superfamily)